MELDTGVKLSPQELDTGVKLSPQELDTGIKLSPCEAAPAHEMTALGPSPRLAGMLRRLLPSALSLGLWIAAVGPAAASPLPSVARPTYVLDGKVESHSTVFFIPAPGDEVGVVAVGAAHSFDLAKLGRAGEVRFERPASKSQVAISSRYLVKPGKPFRMKGGTLRSDYIVFALDLAPSGVTVLEPDPGRLRSGTRVRLLGIPNAIAQDEDDLFGTVVEVGAERIEVELDVPGDLRGWGGAPVVSAETGQLHGILEGAWPVAGTYRVGVAPISGVLEALETPGISTHRAAIPSGRRPSRPRSAMTTRCRTHRRSRAPNRRPYGTLPRRPGPHGSGAPRTWARRSSG